MFLFLLLSQHTILSKVLKRSRRLSSTSNSNTQNKAAKKYPATQGGSKSGALFAVALVFGYFPLKNFILYLK